jgi:tetratricopeptide (TPR) repeat protein
MTGEGRTDALAEALAQRVARAAESSRHDPHAARDELMQVIDLADSSGLDAISAGARYAMARVLVSVGSAESALQLIDDAEQRWRSIGEIEEAIRTNLGRMHVLDDLGRHADAAEVGRSMIVDLEGLGDDDELVWLRAAAGENLGVALGYLGRHFDALEAYASASICYDRLGLTEDSARALANRGVELYELARPEEAIDALERAHREFVELDDRLWQALCQTNLSQAWIAAGRYLEAFTCLDAAETALTGLDRTTELTRVQVGRARCMESLGLDVEALDLYDELIDPLSNAALVDDLGRVHLGRGTILVRCGGSRDDAREAFRSAFAAFESTGDDAMLARTCLAAVPLENDPAALTERAITLLEGGERPAELAVAHLAAAEQLESIDVDRAAASLARARSLIEPLGVPSLRWQIHHRTGRLMRRTGRSRAARREFETALGVLDAIRSSVDRDSIRQRFDGGRSDAVDDLVELLLDTGDDHAGFALSEATRSRGLAERIRSDAQVSGDTPPDELLSTYDRLLTARGDLVDELAGQARRLEQAISTARAGSPTDPSPVSIAADVISYHILGNEVVAFVAGAHRPTVAVRKIGEMGDVESLLRRLEAQWRRFVHPDIVARHGAQLESATVDILARLYDVLLGPLAEHLSADGPLTVVPDGPLGAVPFGALHDGHQFLIERRSVRQTPSITVDELLPVRAEQFSSLLALGTTDDMAPLAATEAQQVGTAWPTATVRVGSAADSATFFDAANDHDIIHIAGHGLFRPDAPEFSGFRLADRWVTAAEIARIRLDGQLVVLSACDTGKRRLDLDLRETLGLPRAFLAAGACGVIVNLWPADDAATVDLMSTLHTTLAAGAGVADALRIAQLHTMSAHRHPYYWGATTLIGGRPTRHPNIDRHDERRPT